MKTIIDDLPPKTSIHDEFCFQAWQEQYDEWNPDSHQYVLIAQFRHLTDCLEFIADRQDRGLNTVYVSPAGVRVVRPSEERMVWKARVAS